jgi:quercetin dioxygenase-like cupin family protein
VDVPAVVPQDVDLQDAWIETDETASWRSASGHGPDQGAKKSGSSLLEVPAGCRLPRHTDSAEEVVVVVAGTAEVHVDDEDPATVPAGGVALVPEGVPHEVRNAGDGLLQFVAVYAANDVVTRYEEPVQPDGDRERKSVGG